jgi:hypothetical protein
MANFGSLDYDPTASSQIQIEAEAVVLRAKLESEGHMSAWQHISCIQSGYSPELVRKHCVEDVEWQKIRLSMKGKPTHEKLAILKNWWDTNIYDMLEKYGTSEHFAKTGRCLRFEVQVGNYLGALRRGGQLDMQNRIRKYI